jgi:DNA-directed RNA polymerase specialized sigma24 family protein
MERQNQPPPTAKTLAILDREWPRLRHRLIGLGLKRTQNLAVAEDLVSDTYEGIRSGRRQWDSERDPDFARFAGSVLLSNIDNWRKEAHNRLRDRKYDVYAHGADQDPEIKDRHEDRRPKLAAVETAPSPEEIVMMRELIERAFAMVFDPRGVEYALLSLFKRGVSDTIEQARILGMPVDEVRETIQRVDRIINNVINHRMIS